MDKIEELESKINQLTQENESLKQQLNQLTREREGLLEWLENSLREFMKTKARYPKAVRYNYAINVLLGIKSKLTQNKSALAVDDKEGDNVTKTD